MAGKHKACNSAEYLKEELKKLIVQRFETGEKLPTESEMMDQFGVSRAMLRDELHALESQGVIVSRQGSGRYVQIPDLGRQIVDTWSVFLGSRPNMLLELLELRELLELSSLPKVINQITVKDLQELNLQANAMMEAAQNGQSMSKHDREFHRILFSTLDNDLLTQLLSAFWDLYDAANIASDHEGTVEMAKQHHDMMDAIISKDVERATGILKRMFEDANYQIILALMK